MEAFDSLGEATGGTVFSTEEIIDEMNRVGIVMKRETVMRAINRMSSIEGFKNRLPELERIDVDRYGARDPG